MWQATQIFPFFLALLIFCPHWQKPILLWGSHSGVLRSLSTGVTLLVVLQGTNMPGIQPVLVHASQTPYPLLDDPESSFSSTETFPNSLPKQTCHGLDLTQISFFKHVHKAFWEIGEWKALHKYKIILTTIQLRYYIISGGGTVWGNTPKLL